MIKYENLFLEKILNKDDRKIGFIISSLFHSSIIFVAIGIPSCFQPKVINIPNIIPIEILTVDEVTNFQDDIEKADSNKEEIKPKLDDIRFSSSEQSEIVKVQKDEIEIPEKDKNIEIIPKKENIKKVHESKPLIKKTPEENIVEYESLPQKKIIPKIKPTMEIDEKKVSDVEVKIKKKPKQNFSISSVLKDLRQKEIQTNIEDEKKEDQKILKDDSNDENGIKFTISEIDLLRQQLKSCWTVPAGAKGAKDMVVKVRVWVNPDRTVSNVRILDTNKMQKDPYFRTVAESAVRAVLNPACSPLKLPPEKYNVWKKFIFKFELGWMLGN